MKILDIRREHVDCFYTNMCTVQVEHKAHTHEFLLPRQLVENSS